MSGVTSLYEIVRKKYTLSVEGKKIHRGRPKRIKNLPDPEEDHTTSDSSDTPEQVEQQRIRREKRLHPKPIDLVPITGIVRTP